MPVDLALARNRLVRRIPVQEWSRLARSFEWAPLAFKQPVIDQGRRVPWVYFPENGVLSMVTDFANGDTVETGTIGDEGLAGIPAVLGAVESAARVFCQIPGQALRLPAAVVQEERERGSVWFALLLRYVNFVTVMVGQTAACNRMHTVDTRLARWLLMTHDRVHANEFPLTQEFLALMLGVARPTVNVAGAALHRAGFIQYTRGRITVVDRAGLESASCECYGVIRRELDRMVTGRRTP